jgi:hypothetical protein
MPACAASKDASVRPEQIGEWLRRWPSWGDSNKTRKARRNGQARSPFRTYRQTLPFGFSLAGLRALVVMLAFRG